MVWDHLSNGETCHYLNSIMELVITQTHNFKLVRWWNIRTSTKLSLQSGGPVMPIYPTHSVPLKVELKQKHVKKGKMKVKI